MTINRDGQAPDEYQGVNPVNRPKNIIATRVPSTGDRRYPIGTLWINTSTNQSWTLTSVVAGSATWALSSPGASDVDTLTGDSGGALSPTGGNINILGGTNMTVAGAGSTLTANMDAAISLATSVTSPLYTAGAGVDVDIEAPSGQDVIIKLGDAAGANKLSVTDSANVEVFAVDSNGGQTYTTITASGLITGQASATINTAGTALTLAADNSGDAVILGGGTSARAITIGQDAAAHTVAIGQAAAGAITIDTAAGVSIDAATASNFSLSGAGADLTLASAAGRVVVNGEEAAANAITLLSAAGGIDVDAALQINIASSQNAADAIRLNASAGGIDIDAVGAAGEDINLTNTGGSIVLSATENAADAISITATVGGIDISAAGAAAGEDIDIVATGSSVNITSTENVGDAIVLSASNGGIDILAPGASAGEDIDIVATGSSVNIQSTEDIADAIKIEATTGGIDILASGAAAGEDIDIVATGSSVNITSTEDNNGAIYIRANGGTSERVRIHADQGTADDSVRLESDAGGISLVSATDITVNGTVKEINAEFLHATGTDLIVQQSPIMQSNANTGAAPTGSNGDVNLMYLQDGCLMEQFIIGTQTIIAPRMSNNGLNIALDQTNAEGAEYNFGARTNAKHAYTIGTSAAFFIEATIYVADLSGCLPLMVGFRKLEANNATLANYTDYACIGLNSTTSATNVVILDELNSGGQTATDTTDAWGGDGTAQTVKVLVSAAGVVTFEVGGSAASAAPSYTFDNADVVIPFIHFLHGADVAGEVGLQNLKIGFQA